MIIFLERASGFYPFESRGNKIVREFAESGFDGKRPGGQGFEKISNRSLISKFPSGPLPYLAKKGNETFREI